jgi:hypothetical protein
MPCVYDVGKVIKLKFSLIYKLSNNATVTFHEALPPKNLVKLDGKWDESTSGGSLYYLISLI